MHQAGHPCRDRQRARAGTCLAMRGTADRGRHRRPGALAAGRLAERRNAERPAHCAGHRAAAAPGGGGLGGGPAAAAVGWCGRGGQAARAAGPGAGTGSAGRRRGQGPGAQRRPRSSRTHHFHLARGRTGATAESGPAVAWTASRAIAEGAARRSGRIVRRRGQPGAGHRAGGVLHRSGPAGRARSDRPACLVGRPLARRRTVVGCERPRSGRTARAQVLLDGAGRAALLLCYRQRRWYLEGVYE